MPEEVLFESESQHDRSEVAAYLRDVADKLDDGAVTLSAGDQSVSLDVPARVTFEVKVERETSRGGENPELGLELELEWAENGDESNASLSVE